MVASWLVASLLTALPFEVDARELQAVRQRIGRERVRNRYLRQQESQSQRAVRELNRSIADRAAAVDRLDREVARIERRLHAAIAELQEVSGRYDEVHQRAGGRAAALVRIRRIGVEALLVGLADPIELRRAEDRFRFVLEHDRALAEKVRRVRQERTQAVAEVGRLRQGLDAARAQLLEEREQLARRVAERQELVRALRKERRRSDVLARLLREAESGAVREASVIRGHVPPGDPRPGGFADQKGALPWPTAGRVEVTFGRKVDPPTGVVLEQTGIDLRASDGALGRVPFEGKVVVARWIRGFGRTVVVDHGQGYHTVYAHLQQTWTEAGRSVGRLQAIGTVGATGSTKGAYLYFELRRGGVPLEPLEWLLGPGEG